MRINNQTRNEFWRTKSPEETIETIKEGLRKLKLTEDIKLMRSCDDLWSARLEVSEIKAFSNGKGVTKEQALASAYAEFAERLSAIETGINIGPYRSLYGEKGNILGRITRYQYMPGYKWTHQDNIENSVGVEQFLKEYDFNKGQLEYVKYSSELLRHWIPGFSLVHNKEVYIPILFVKWISSSNGLASGNTIEEAIVHGVCEIFERDAMIKYLKSMVHEEILNIDPESICDKQVQRILAYFSDNDIDVVIKDIGQKIYPVYAILTFNKKLTTSDVGYNMMKAGCAFNSLEAIKRCFTERMQGTRFDFEAHQGTISDNTDPNRYMPLFFKGICPMNLNGNRENRQVEFSDYRAPDMVSEIDSCIDIAKKLGTDLIVVDHTHPVLQFPTARVIMPAVSDFIKWWGPNKITMNFIGNLEPDEDLYEEKLMEILRTFEPQHTSGKSAKNKSRRDV